MSKKNSGPGAFRSALDQMLRAAKTDPVTSSEWAILVKWEFLRQFEEGEPDTLNDAFRFVTDARLSQTNHVSPPLERLSKIVDGATAKPSERVWYAMSIRRIFAAHAMERDAETGEYGILAFRKQILEGRLVPHAEAGAWVLEQAKRDGKGTVHAYTNASGGKGWRIETLAYCVEGDQWVHRVPVKAGGVLDRLREVSKKLETAYGWSDAHASFFVLTGIAPNVPLLSSTVSRSFPLQARSRIMLDVHPTCTPQEVAAWYQQVKRENFGRLRRVGAKHASLAAFYAEQPEEASTKNLLKSWNALCAEQKHAEWRYLDKHSARFIRDAKLAVDRVANLGGSKGRVRFHRTATADVFSA